MLNHYPYINPIFNQWARQRPNILQKYKKSKPCQGDNLIHLLDKVDPKEHQSIYNFFEQTIPANFHMEGNGKKLYHHLKRYISMVMGTRLINDGKILLHGHNHSENRRMGNMINLCGEAWDYTPVSLEQVSKEIKNYDEEKNQLLNNDKFALDNIELLQWYAKNYELNNKAKEFKELFNTAKKIGP